MKTNTTLKTGRNYLGIAAFLLCSFFFSPNAPAQNNIHSFLGESWTGTGWQNSVQGINTFDGSNYLIKSLVQSWLVPSSTWQNSVQILYTNNANGTANQSLSQTWDTSTSAWTNGQRSTYTYNASNKVLTTVTEIYLVAWQNFSKETNTYGAGGYLTNSVYQSWDFLTSTYVNASQDIYVNNADGTVSQSTTQTWNSTTSTWVNSVKSNYTYNVSGRILSAISQTWTGTAWQNDTREIYTYNGSGFLINELSQNWDTTSVDWVNSTQSNITNDGAGNPIEIIGQSWTPPSTWTNESRITFVYNLGLTDFTKESAFTLYPNPADDMFTIKSNIDSNDMPYILSDENGRTVMSGKLKADETIVDINNLSSGVYFFRTGQNNGFSTKMIKK